MWFVTQVYEQCVQQGMTETHAKAHAGLQVTCVPCAWQLDRGPVREAYRVRTDECVLCGSCSQASVHAHATALAHAGLLPPVTSAAVSAARLLSVCVEPTVPYS